jgi:hypothetical protein
MNIKEYLKNKKEKVKDFLENNNDLISEYIPLFVLIVGVIIIFISASLLSSLFTDEPTIKSRTKSISRNLGIVCLDGITYWDYAHTYSSTITLKVDINGKPIPCKLVE